MGKITTADAEKMLLSITTTYGACVNNPEYGAHACVSERVHPFRIDGQSIDFDFGAGHHLLLVI